MHMNLRMSAFDDDFWDPDADGDGGSVAGNDGRAANAESYHDEEAQSRLAAFYAEAASKRQLSDPSPDDAPSRPLSQASALSAAELSAAEEALFSQSSHRDRAEESERQRQKLERKARRERGIKAKRKPRTEAQDKREREYQRMRRKGTDYDGEADVGGAVERLVRRRLGEESQRGRLKAEAKEREGKRRREEEAGAYLDGDNEATTETVEAKAGDGRGINWNYADEGYATMPHADAEKLPYYVYGNNGQTSDAPHRKKKRRRNTGAPRVHNVSHFANAFDEADRSPRAFPLRFHQLKPRMDLRSMLDLQSGGSERMTVAHGRNAKRLWARMVAGGARIAEGEALLQHNEANGAGGSKKAAFRTDDGSLSNVSSSDSSASSERSYQPTAVHSQMTYGTTSLVDMAKVEEGKNVEDKPKQHGPLLRLMAAVHGLPKTTHRNQVLRKVAKELGAGRRAWEAELRTLVEGAGEDGRDKKKNDAKLTPTEVWALKSFLGVEGRMSMPPSWTYDPSLPTLLKRQLDKVRGPLLRRLRRRMTAGEGGSMPGDTAAKETEAGEGLGAELDATGTNSELEEGAKVAAQEEATDNVKTEDTQSDVEVAESEPAVDREEGFQGLKEEEGEGNLDGTELGADGVGASTKLLSSLIDELPTDNDLSGVDKYAKIIHESNIDTSNIDVALASFLNELTGALARLRESQEGDASHFQYQHALEVAQEEVRHWHESVLSYLSLAESLTRPREANYYKKLGSGGAANYPENAPLSTAVMATQAYLANSGGVGRVPRKKGLPSSQWEVKDEVPSSDESEAGDRSALDSKALDSHPREDDSEKMDLRGIQLAAKDIARRGEDCLTNAHLTSFTPISLTVGVAVIAKHLTPAAAELVSRQCAPDASDDRTPFDLIKNTIALIEEDGSLVSQTHASSSSKGYIRDEMLLQSMQEAAMLFRGCIEKDPESVDHWAWYVATFLGMLCVSCGTRQTGETEVEVEHKRPERQRLECFHEVRSHASTAVSDFVKFAQRHGCSAFHFAATSMLEWTNAICLLVRPQSNPNVDEEYCLQVRRLHAYHIYHWARADCSSAANERVHQLCSTNLLPRDALLDVLAGAVERNPSERRNWARLVEALGKVTSKANDGGECLRKEGTWWGQRRAEEWADEFFHAPKSTTIAVKPEFVRMVLAAVKSALSDAPKSQRKPPAHTAPGDDEASCPNPDECLGWLWNPTDEDADADGDVDSFTTGTLPTKPDADEPKTQDSHLSCWDADELDPHCEAICMKVLVACHLMGPWHPFVCNSVWGLAANHWQSMQEKSEDGDNKGLLWLSQCGLDVAAYLRRRRPTRSESLGGA